METVHHVGAAATIVMANAFNFRETLRGISEAILNSHRDKWTLIFRPTCVEGSSGRLKLV